jgi:hypothetical protein
MCSRNRHPNGHNICSNEDFNPESPKVYPSCSQFDRRTSFQFQPTMNHSNQSYLKLILAGAVLAAASAPVFGQTTLAQWTFETSQPVTAGPFAPEVGLGSTSGSHAGASVYSSPAGNGSAHSLSSTLWAVGDYYQFQVSTVGFSGIDVSWDQTSSNTGPKDFALLYGTDGASFSQFATYSVLANASPNNLWSATTVHPEFGFSKDLTSITALNNAANVYFRLVDLDTVSASSGTVGTGGTDRVDNFTVTAIPEPSTYALLVGLAGFAVVLWRRNSRETINATA